jgi:hypothetical protein
MNNPDHIFELKNTKFLMRIRDPGWRQFGSGIRDGKKSDPGSGMEKSRIRDKHPVSATLVSSLAACCFNLKGFSALLL